MNTPVATAPVASEEELARVGPPLFVLLLGAACVLVSLFLLTVPAGIEVNVVGYVLGSVMAILCIGLFRRLDLLRRKNPGYVARPALARLVPLLGVAAVVAAALHVWPIATELAS